MGKALIFAPISRGYVYRAAKEAWAWVRKPSTLGSGNPGEKRERERKPRLKC